MSDKRIHQRFVVNLPARCKISGPEHSSFLSIILDISPSGICFESKLKAEVGSIVVFQIELEDRGKVMVKTRVVWTKPGTEAGHWKTGVTIMNANDEDEKRFVQYYCDKILIRPPERQKKILVVEDKKEENDFLRTELSDLPYAMIYALDGEEGFGKYRLERPDLIIVDERLAKMEGVAFCKKVRGEESDHRTAIILLTDRRENPDKYMGRAIGADRYLTKPVSAKELRKAVVELLRIV